MLATSAEAQSSLYHQNLLQQTQLIRIHLPHQGAHHHHSILLLLQQPSLLDKHWTYDTN